MARKRFGLEQVVSKLRQIEVLMDEGKSLRHALGRYYGCHLLPLALGVGWAEDWPSPAVEGPGA